MGAVKSVHHAAQVHKNSQLLLLLIQVADNLSGLRLLCVLMQVAEGAAAVPPSVAGAAGGPSPLCAGHLPGGPQQPPAPAAGAAVQVADGEAGQCGLKKGLPAGLYV
jgi:hypothetical protein